LGIPDLIEALEDKDYEVRNAAWREFRKAVEEAFKKIIRREKR
jgi:hypothetical protein